MRKKQKALYSSPIRLYVNSNSDLELIASESDDSENTNVSYDFVPGKLEYQAKMLEVRKKSKKKDHIYLISGIVDKRQYKHIVKCYSIFNIHAYLLYLK